MSAEVHSTPLEDILSLSMGTMLPVPIFVTFAGMYYFASPYFETERKRAYILSTLSSATMSCISLPYAYNYIFYGLNVAYVAGQNGWTGAIGKFGVVFFGTYLAADLLIGYFKYRSQVGLLTGWIHHVCYILLMVYCLNSGQHPIFMMAGIMELPTFDLAISNLFPKVRHDLRFLISFFLIRIAYHLVLILDCIRPSSRAITNGSNVPITMLGLSFILHVSWFQGGVKGYLKRAKAQQEIAKAEEISVYEDLSTPILGTPEDSPLVTPHTPSLGASRDSYLPAFPKGLTSLPNLASLPSMPHMPQLPLSHIPTVSIPSFSDLTAALHAGDQLNWGFKDAVKTRWEEQRGRFQGRVQDVRGLKLNLSNIRLRRGTAEQDEAEDEVAVME